MCHFYDGSGITNDHIYFGGSVWDYGDLAVGSLHVGVHNIPSSTSTIAGSCCCDDGRFLGCLGGSTNLYVDYIEVNDPIACVGVCDNAGSAGDTNVVTLKGKRVGGYSGLTKGARYYYNGNALTKLRTRYYAGVAVNDTEILLM
jgi:hypothetical protein